MLFVNTKQQPPLGADTWIHLQVMKVLDRSRFAVQAACVRGKADEPTVTYRELRKLPEVTIREVDFGRELAAGTVRERVVAVLTLVPAIWSMLRLALYIRRQRISLLHCADRPRDAFACAVLARLTGAKYVVHMHVGFDARWMRKMLQWSIRKADAVIAISEFVARTLIDEAGCDPAKVHVVLNGIEIERWEPGVGRDQARTELGLDDATPVVITVCRLFPSKGTGELIQALHDITPDVSDAVLLVVGEEMVPGYQEELTELARRSGVADRIRFLGRRPDVAPLMAASEVFSMPSFGEPFGLVYTEAMAMQLPVVGLANGGTVEVVEDGVTGLLSAPEDAAALAANLAALLQDPDRRKAFGVAGRERAERLFTVEHMTAGVAEVFTLLASARTGASDGRPSGE